MILELGREYPTPEEAPFIQQIAAQITSDLVKRAHDLKWTVVRRDGHPKAHGLVRAEFHVDANLPPELARGVFAEPRTYQAYIRFSNAYFDPSRHDAELDMRGMAIKLIGVVGEKEIPSAPESQDFMLVTHRIFFVKDAQEYIEFIHALNENPALAALKFPKFATAVGVIRNPLTTTYFSQTAYALGPNQAVKYSARPTEEHDPGSLAAHLLRALHHDYLREAMTAWLQDRDAVFDFMVQRQIDADEMPVEDPTVEWSMDRSPFRKVATIVIPKQEFASPAQFAFAENLSFNPWHTLTTHRPLGVINRTRRVVYEEVSRLRHQMNRVPEREPTGDETF